MRGQRENSGPIPGNLHPAFHKIVGLILLLVTLWNYWAHKNYPVISGPLSSSETAYILSMQCISLQTNLFPHLVLRTEPPCQPTCTPHKHSVLINLLIYILPLAESLLCWDIKNVSFTMSRGSSDESGVLGESGCISMYSWAPLLFTWDYHSIVNWVYLNTKCFRC